MNSIKTAWLILALLGVGLFLSDYLRIHKGKKAVGPVRMQWSLRLNPGIRGNWVVLGIILFYGAATGYFFVKSPAANSNYLLVAVFILVMGYSFFKWQFIYGERGFIHKTKVVRNEQIIKKGIVVSNGDKNLSISYLEDGPGKQTIDILIPIPHYKKSSLIGL